MWPTLLIIIYCILVVVASLLGGSLPSLFRISHTRMQMIMSFVGGLMLGVAILHLLPHAAVEAGSLDRAAGSAVLGLLAMFFVIRIFELHGHEPHTEDGRCEHPAHDHARHNELDEHREPHAHSASWLGLFIGLGLHTLIDGIALAASVAAGAQLGAAGGLIGLGTFLAVVLHKPLDALAITSVMLGGGWSDGWRTAINLAFSLMCPLGALVFFFGIQTLSDEAHYVVGCALGFAAGAFLCISLADLLPEVQFHRHDRWKLSAALVIGVVLAWLIGFAEPQHAHTPAPTAPAHGHAHDGFDVH